MESTTVMIVRCFVCLVPARSASQGTSLKCESYDRRFGGRLDVSKQRASSMQRAKQELVVIHGTYVIWQHLKGLSG
jgi:hypothetical protein